MRKLSSLSRTYSAGHIRFIALLALCPLAACNCGETTVDPCDQALACCEQLAADQKQICSDAVKAAQNESNANACQEAVETWVSAGSCKGTTNDAGTGDGGGGDAGGSLRGEVEAIITSDNAYSFGWGSETEINSYFTTPGAIEACEIFCCPVGGPDGAGDGRGPERYVVPPEDTGVGSYLYVLAWADESTTQGTLGQLRRTDGKGNTFYTGQGDWQVCATGKNLERNSNPPTKEWIKTELANCTAGAGAPASSGGWVDVNGAVTPGALGKLAIGEKNDSSDSGNFPITCQEDVNGHGIDAQANWMWYNWDPDNVSNPFVDQAAQNPWKDVLIFRIELQKVVVIVD